MSRQSTQGGGPAAEEDDGPALAHCRRCGGFLARDPDLLAPGYWGHDPKTGAELPGDPEWEPAWTCRRCGRVAYNLD